MMGVRLIEMHRLLKSTGSIYLHCDDTATHYLKLLMDAVFGSKNFRNAIIWKRFNFHSDAKRFGRVSDTILFYAKSDAYIFNRQRTPFSKEYTDSKFRYTDMHGRRFRLDNLNPPGGRGPVYEFRGVKKAWRYTQEKMSALDREGRIYDKSNIPQLKRYLDELEGQAVHDIWQDIPPINPRAKERIGYPTQKPLALLNRIVASSSNVGDIVLDPFCGCATTCVSADKSNRNWIGIDISPKAVELVNIRLQDELGSLYHSKLVISRADVPKRTDTGKPVPYQKNKHVLFGQQEGCCNGCGQDGMGFRNLEVDHKTPRSKGGTDHIDNLQLLCGFCNRTKGDKDQAYLITRLKELNII